MVLDRQELGIIDFQDAVIGPISYDLASLLRDCYIEWPDAQVQHWLQNYYRKLQNAKLSTVDFEQFQYWFDLIGLQRHLKAIGIFSRLHLRDNKPAYLADIPRTMNYVSNVSARYPELAEFSGFLKHQVLPVYKAAL
jgi:aminoglycoside/choline kinase family phosphotransferase